MSSGDLDSTARLPVLEGPPPHGDGAAHEAAGTAAAVVDERLRAAEAQNLRYLEALKSHEWHRGIEDVRLGELESQLALAHERLAATAHARDALAVASADMRSVERGRQGGAPPHTGLQAARIGELEGIAAGLARALQAQTDAARLATSPIAAIERAAGEQRGRVRFLEDELIEARREAEEHVRAARSADATLTEIQASLVEAGARIRRLEDEALGAAHAAAAQLDSLKHEHHKQTLLLERTRGALEERELQIRRLERNLSRRNSAPGETDAAAAAPEAAGLVPPGGGVLRPLDGSAPWPIAGGRRTSIGRAIENDLCINEASISRHHARVIASSGGTFIEDLSSANGVGINGRRVRHARLSDGDVVMLGSQRFEFVAAHRSAARAQEISPSR